MCKFLTPKTGTSHGPTHFWNPIRNNLDWVSAEISDNFGWYIHQYTFPRYHHGTAEAQHRHESKIPLKQEDFSGVSTASVEQREIYLEHLLLPQPRQIILISIKWRMRLHIWKPWTARHMRRQHGLHLSHLGIHYQQCKERMVQSVKETGG